MGRLLQRPVVVSLHSAYVTQRLPMFKSAGLHTDVKPLVQWQEAPKNGQPLPVVEQNETCFIWKVWMSVKRILGVYENKVCTRVCIN